MRLVSKTQFAAMAQVSGPAVTKQIRRALLPAMVKDRIDIDHPAATGYLERRGVQIPRSALPPETSPNPRPKPALAPVKADATEPEPAEPTPEDIGFYRDMPFGEVVERFGTSRTMRDWLLALKELEVLRDKRMDVAAAQGRLISRELVKVHVIGVLDTCNRSLLADAAQTIATRLFTLARSDASLEEGQRVASEIISSHLKVAFEGAARNLRDAAGSGGPR